MTLYYINKQTEQVCQCGFEIQKGDIVFLHSNYEVKTIYIDSPVDETSIWRDYRFLDSKSLKSYTFPKTNAVVCKPYRNCKAEGDSQLLQKLITECKNEWLTDFLQETNSILSGICQYWDIDQLRRFTRDESLQEEIEDGEAVAAKIVVEDEATVLTRHDFPATLDHDAIARHYRYLIEFCMLALVDYDEDLTDREHELMRMLLKGYSQNEVAKHYQITPERVRQIFWRVVQKVKNDHERFSCELRNLRDENKILRHKLMTLQEDKQNTSAAQIEASLDIAAIMTTSVEELNLPIRVINCLKAEGINIFAEIPQIRKGDIWRFPNCGSKSVADLTSFLKNLYLTFGMSYNQIVEQLEELNLQYVKECMFSGDHKPKRNQPKEIKKENKPKIGIKHQTNNSDAPQKTNIDDIISNLKVDHLAGEKDILVIPNGNHKRILIGEDSYVVEKDISDSILWWKELLIIQKISKSLRVNIPIRNLYSLVPKDVVNREQVLNMLSEISKAAFNYDIRKIDSTYSERTNDVNHKIISPENKTNVANETVPDNFSMRGARWDAEQESELIELFNLGFNYSEIAQYMGRSEVSIMSRLGMLGIIDYTYNKGKS